MSFAGRETAGAFAARLAGAHEKAAVLADALPYITEFAGKVVVLIYTGKISPTIGVRGAQVKLHQLFVAELRDLFGALKALSPAHK